MTLNLHSIHDADQPRADVLAANMTRENNRSIARRSRKDAPDAALAASPFNQHQPKEGLTWPRRNQPEHAAAEAAVAKAKA
jgi:hypothetical protein